MLFFLKRKTGGTKVGEALRPFFVLRDLYCSWGCYIYIFLTRAFILVKCCVCGPPEAMCGSLLLEISSAAKCVRRFESRICFHGTTVVEKHIYGGWVRFCHQRRILFWSHRLMPFRCHSGGINVHLFIRFILSGVKSLIPDTSQFFCLRRPLRGMRNKKTWLSPRDTRRRPNKCPGIDYERNYISSVPGIISLRMIWTSTTVCMMMYALKLLFRGGQVGDKNMIHTVETEPTNVEPKTLYPPIFKHRLWVLITLLTVFSTLPIAHCPEICV